VNALCQLHGIRHTLSSAYHPQTNGLVERFNQTLCKSLAKISHERNEDWDNLIPSVLFAYRTMRHSTTRHSPFYLTYGRDATLPVEFQFPIYPSEPIDEMDNLLRHTYQLIDKLPPALNKAHQNIVNSQDYSKQRHDNRIPDLIPLKIGDKVWLERKQHSHKFAPKWLGPFYIHEVLQNSAYRLRRIHDGTVLPNTYHGTRLKLYKQYKTLEPIVVIE
jgi:transposase InsO family protein